MPPMGMGEVIEMGAASNHLFCTWCGTSFLPRRSGGLPQRFCSNTCRNAFHVAARRWATKKVHEGTLSVAALKDLIEPCTLGGGSADGPLDPALLEPREDRECNVHGVDDDEQDLIVEDDGKIRGE